MIHNEEPLERYVALDSCRTVIGEAKPPPKQPWPSKLKKKTRDWYRQWYFNKSSGKTNRRAYRKYIRAYKNWKNSPDSK